MTHRVGPVGFEPTSRRSKSPLQSSFATSPRHVSSHPLESNQNLSGFSRARRPTTQEWDTSAAHVGSTRGARSSSSSSSIVRDRWDRRAQGAPRALMHPPVTRAHLSRFEICIQIASRKSVVVVVDVLECDGRKRKGPPGFPGGPSARRRVVHVMCGRTSRGTRIETDADSELKPYRRAATRGMVAHGRRARFRLAMLI